MTSLKLRMAVAHFGPRALALLGFALAFAAGLFACRRSIFQDEGAVVLNFAVGFWGFFSPLPYYDQAAPPLSMAVLSAIYHLVGGNLDLTRVGLLVLSMAFFAGTLLVALRRRDLGMVYGLLILLAIRPVLLNATELKQYIFEVMFAVALILMHWARGRDYSPGYLAAFLAVALVSILFSFSSMFIVVPVMFDIIICRENKGRRLLWIGGAALFCLVWVATYLTLVKPLVALQFINYGKEYGGLTLLNVLMNRDMTSLSIMLREVRGIGPHLFLVVAVPVLLLLWWRAPKPLKDRIWPPLSEALAARHAPARLLLYVCGGLGALNLAGIYPFSTTRQLLYVSPVIALFLGWLTVRMLKAFGLSAPARILALGVMIAPGMLYNLVEAERTSYVKTDVWDLYQFIKKNGYKHVVSWVVFDPTIHVFYRDDTDKSFEVKGLLNPASAPNLSVAELKRRLEADDDDIPNQLWSVLKREEDFRTYVDWVVRRVTRNAVTLIATVEIFPYQEVQLMDALKAAGCTGKAVFEEKAVKAFEVHCDGPAPPRPAQ
ncbi:hypothetical protein [Aquabacter cavernae]|uniref:hypothetical protein n=1 Tax=Aquabacter cavernae TaxID=2496029 RepID=UPI000F8E1466|nr:hypothetical protein [Aquabacter cavernae]